MVNKEIATNKSLQQSSRKLNLGYLEVQAVIYKIVGGQVTVSDKESLAKTTFRYNSPEWYPFACLITPYSRKIHHMCDVIGSSLIQELNGKPPSKRPP